MNYFNVLLFATLLFGSCATQSSQEITIIPKPKVVKSIGEREFSLDKDHKIGISDISLRPAAEYLNLILSKSTGYKLSIEQGSGDIELILNEGGGGPAGSYSLSVGGDRVSIEGNDYGAIISGVATLRQLFPDQIEETNSNIAMTLPTIEIKDSPLYEWRGLMLDVSRHFYTTDEVKTLLDLMAMYKLNKFHWHLTDDQGWRIEIKQFPLLTEKGAWRKFNHHDRECMRLARLGDDNQIIPDDRLKIVGRDTLYGGFYTQDQIREVITYAAVRGIDVMPEIDMPGHFLSAIENYDNIACFDTTGWGEHFSSPICPGKESAMEFCKKIYGEVFELFPFEYVHLGADEVEKVNWKKCPDCQKRMKDNNLQTEEELQSWFVRDLEGYFNENGKKLIGWDEITEGGVSPTAAIMWWRKGHGKAVAQASERGNRVIVSTSDYFYFDREQSPLLLKEFYESEYRPTGVCKEDKDIIMGVQGNIWTEWIPSIDHIIYKSFPRFMVLAEKAWSSYDNQSWSGFLPRFESHLERFNVMGLNYRIPDLETDYPVNSFVEQQVVEFGCWDSTVELRYTLDGSEPTPTSLHYTEPITIWESTNFKIAPFRRDGTHGDIIAIEYNKAVYPSIVEVDNVELGLNVARYNFAGHKCDEIEKSPFVANYKVDSIVLIKEAPKDVGLIYSGFIEVADDGVYTFKLTSDDGSLLYINDRVVVDNDGDHGSVTIFGQVALSRGKHPICLKYFDSRGGEIMLEVLDKDLEPLPRAVKYYRER